MSYSNLPPEMYGIRPIMKAPGGWRVCIVRRHIRYCGSFSVARYGDLESALDAAKQWRDAVPQDTCPMLKAEHSSIVRRHHTSGHPGVILKRQCSRRVDGSISEHVFWQVQSPGWCHAKP